MKFVLGLIVGFVAANLESASVLADKLADGLEAIAYKIHNRTIPDEEQE